MPTPTKSRYTSSNAYDITIERPSRYPYFDEPVITPGRSRRMTDRAVEVKEAEAVKEQANKVSMLKVAGIIACVFAICAIMIYRYAMILQANDTISNKQKEYTGILAQNQLIEKEIDKFFETSALEKLATEHLGMVKVDTTQIIYVDLNMVDSGENVRGKSADEKTASLMGTPGTLIRAFQMLR